MITVCSVRSSNDNLTFAADVFVKLFIARFIMASAIDAIVDAYVSTGNISALEAMKAHRAALLADTTDRDGFSFAVVRSTIEGDIAAIDTALLKLRPANPASPDATSDD